MYEAIRLLVMNVSLFGTGMLFGILGIIFGATRGMTKEHEVMPLIFSSIAWVIALIVPNAIFAGSVFLAGAIGITIAFIPLIKTMRSSNIYGIAVLGMLVNIALLIGSGAFMASLDWGDNINSARNDMEAMLSTVLARENVDLPDLGICTPQQQEVTSEYDSASTDAERQDILDENGLSSATELCRRGFLGGVASALNFDVVSGLIAVASYVGKLASFIGMAVYVPLIIMQKISSNIVNPVISSLIGLMITAFNIVILVNLFRFIFNRRGEE